MNAIKNSYNVGTFLLFVLLGFMTYSNALHSDFMIDDYGLMFQDNRIHSWKYLYLQLIPDENKFLKIEDLKISSYYRPVAHLVVMINYLLFKDNVFYYHSLNLFLFIISAWLLFVLLELLCNNRILSLWAALIYIVHPINGLMVNYITACVYAVQSVIFFLSAICFLKGLNNGHKRAYSFLSVLFFVLGVLTHETSFIWPFYFVLVIWMQRKLRWKELIKIFCPYFLVLLLFFVARLKFASLGSNILEKISSSHITVFQFLATFTKLILWYLSKLLFLQNIVIIWATPIIKGSWGLIFVFMVLVGLLGVAYKLRLKWPLVTLSLFWLALGFLPVTLASFFVPSIGLMIEPHWLYPANVGFFLLITFLIIQSEQAVGKIASRAVLIFFMLACLFSSRGHNDVWSDETRYCQFWIKQVPQYKSAYFCLASSFMKKNDLKNARENYEKALADDSYDWQIYNNLGLMDQQEGHTESALGNFLKAKAIFPKSVIVSNNLGLIYLKQNNLNLAEESFKSAIQYDPFSMEPRLNLAQIYERHGQFDQAIRLYNENLNIDPTHRETILNLLRVYIESNRREDLKRYVQGFTVTSKDVGLLINTASFLAASGEIPSALHAFEKALKLNPSDSQIYLELGKLYGNFDAFDQAILIWQAGQKFDPADQRFEENIRRARQLQVQKNQPSL